VVSDAHKGLKAAIVKVLGATWQRCRVHFMRNALAHVGKAQQVMVVSYIRSAFAQTDEAVAHAQGRKVADQLRPKVPKLAALMDEAEDDVLAHMAWHKNLRAKLHSTNPLERLNKEIKQHTNVVDIFPNNNAIVRLVCAPMLEQNDEWAVTRRYMTTETIGEICNPDDVPFKI
jgi:transposase-like protein